VPARALKSSREDHVDSLNWTTGSGQQRIASANCFDGVGGERCGGRCQAPLEDRLWDFERRQCLITLFWKPYGELQS
jgi:hypothetical protein